MRLSAAIVCGVSCRSFLRNADFGRSGRRTHGLSVFGSAGLAFIISLLASSVVSAQSVTVTPTSLSFGSQPLSITSGAKAATLKNGTSGPITISSVSVSGDYAQTNTCGASLAAGASCTISLTFTPTATGSRTGTLTITDSASNSPQTVSLSGTGVLQATVSPASLSFGSQALATTSAAKSVTLKNNLPTALSISSITTTGDYAQTNNCGTSLAAGASCTVNVTFTPTTTGSRTGTLTIADNASNSPQTVSLSGTGVAQAAVSPASLSFGNQVVGFASAAKTVTLANNLQTGLTISSIATSGDYSQTNTCGTALAAGANCTISVTFTPTTTGSRTGALTITDNTNNSPQAVSLTGNGVVPVTVSPASLAFGSQAVTTTSAAKTVTVSNKQPTAVSISSITTPTAYVQTNTCGSSLAAQGTCTVSVTFSPTTTGSQPGTLTITDSASNSPQTVNLTGTGTALPVITSLSVTSGVVGTSVTITGTGFGSPQGSSTVTFNGVLATATTWKSTSIVVTVPAAATTGNVVVTVNGGASNGVAFTVVPHISSLSASSGIAGTSVTITGSGFGSLQGGSTVTFSGNAATPTTWSATSITVPVPAGAPGGSGSVVVTAGGAASNGVAFTVVPNISSFSVSSGVAGTQVTINGSGFGSLQGGSTVTFSGVATTPTAWSATSITAPVPAGATGGSGIVVVTVGGVASSGTSFTVIPNITSLSPTSGIVGTSVTISGTGFGVNPSTVTLNGTSASPTSWSAGSISVSVPTGANTGNVIVTVNGVASSGVGFLVAPNISSIAPSSGIIGTTVTISGTGFGSSPGTVTFNGTAAATSGWTPGQITVTVPAGATTGNAVVTASGVASNGVGFAVAPNITGVSPSAGAVGTTVTISGTGLGASPGTVTFNGTTATPTSWSAGSITVPVPTGATTGTVVVTASGITSNGVSFTVQALGFVAAAGSMASPRYGQTATQLANGQVFIAGGMSSSGVLNSAELYTPAGQVFATAANPMNVARWLHTATLLDDGTVLIVGGSSLSNETTLNSAEIYDPVAGTFTLLPSALNTARVGHTATLLSNGQVLIVGGFDPSTGIISDAELYDPFAQVFIDLGNTNTPRFHHTATLLQNGQVLITGGETDPTPSGAYNNAEIFNPTTWTFATVAANMISGREGHAATLLNDGTVLITGGDNPPAGSLNTAEIYNVTSNTFTAVSAAMTSPRIFHDSVLLNGGQVLLSGGENDSSGTSTALNTAELYNPTTQTFAATAGSMSSAREHQTAALLNDGTVLEDGGTDGTNVFNTAEIYTASQLTGLTSIAVSPSSPSVPLGSQQLFVATGTFSDGSTQVLSCVLWSSSSTSIAVISKDASNNGYVATVAQGTATITAVAAGISGSATITIPAPALVSITVSPTNLTMPLGTSQQLVATGTYSDGSTQDLTATANWSSSSSSTTVSSAGLVTAAVLGASTIQATSGSYSSSINVSVGAPALLSVSVTPASATLRVGQSQQYQAFGTYTDGSTQNLTASVSWFAVPGTAASVNSSGLVTAMRQGSVDVTASYGNFSGTSTLTIGLPNLISIAVLPGTASIPVGSNQQFVAVGSYSDGTTKDITSSVSWSSSTGTASSISATGLATALAGGSTTISASSGSVTGVATLTITTGTIALSTSRYQHSATLLNDGTVLIAGGVSCPSAGSCTYLNSAELYNASAGTISSTGGMTAARSAPAVLLGNGKVLVAGGYSCDSNGNCSSLSSAEIYDPAAGTFSSAGTMTVARDGHTMTMLNNGQVLIAGGETCTSATLCVALNTAELYNPALGTFTATGNLNKARFNASAVRLSTGQVFIAGGFDGTNYISSGEQYDAATGTFVFNGTLHTPRAGATITVLDNIQVMVAGGTTCNTPSCPTASTELYYSGFFYYPTYPTGNMTVPRSGQTATLLTNGQVLFAGGFDSCASSCISDGTTELFDPLAVAFSPSQTLSTGRSGHTATLLTDASVLLVGGIDNGVTLSSTDLYQPASLASPQLVSITVSQSNPVAVGQTVFLSAIGNFSDGSTYPLQSVIWSSSSPSVATVSNAAGSAGIVNTINAGTATINATVGTIVGSTTITATTPLVSIAVTPSSQTTSIGSTEALTATATGTYADGSTLDVTSQVTWSSSNTSIAAVFEIPGNPAVVVPAAPGTTTVSASLGNVSGSTTVTVNMPLAPVPPSISAVSPTSGAAGTQVVITGSGFGATQGSGKVWLGTNLAVVISWSDTQVVATVSTGSSSGVVEIQQSSGDSNSVPFTIGTATIAGVSPNNGLPGTQVTISGSGFGAAQGNGSVWLGTAPAIVNSWSDGQVVATVAAGAATGNAQVLQNGVMSNAVPFTINLPHITWISPNSGSAGTVVTVTGSGFGATQGSGNIWIGSDYGSVVGWSDTQVVASVASNAVSGIVSIEQNGTFSNGMTFTVPTSFSGTGSTVVALSPNLANMLVGGTQPIQALDANGQSVMGLTWTSSDTTVATLSTDDPPVITAVGPGKAMISAGNAAAASVTVWSGSTLPTTTVIWSNPGDGTGVSSIVPAVPSSTGVADVFALNASGNLQAIRADGSTAWTQSIGRNSLIPDFQGGAVVYTGSSIYRLDGMTGQPSSWTYTSAAGNNLSTPVVHTNGTIFTIDGNLVVGINPTTGQTFSVAMENSTVSGSGDGCPNRCSSPLPPSGQNYSNATPPSTGSLIIAGDGYAYVPYIYEVLAGSHNDSGCPCGCSDSWSSTQYLRLLRIGPTGDSYEISLGDYSGAGWSVSCSTSPIYSWGSSYSTSPTMPTLITNADQGVLASYLVYYSNGALPSYYLATTSGTSIVSNAQVPAMVPEQVSAVQPILQRADGSYIGTVFSGEGTFMVAFTAAGSTLWTALNDTPQIATAGGGVIGASGTTYDDNGNVTGQIGTLPTYSWKGIYSLGSIDSLSLPIAPFAETFAAFAGGNQTANSTAFDEHKIGLFWCGKGYGEMGPCEGSRGVDVPWNYIPFVTGDNYGSAQNFSKDYPSWVDTIEAAALDALTKAFPFPVTVERASSHKGTALECLEHGPHLPGCIVWDELDRVFVSGNWSTGVDTGETTGISPPFFSWVYYWTSLRNSESNLDLNPPYPPKTNADKEAFARLLQAIGRGIGNAAAHELAHHVEFTFKLNMDCPRLASCVGNNGIVFEKEGGFPEEYRYTYPAIQWQPNSFCAIEQYYQGQGWRDPKIGCTTDFHK